MCGPTVATSSWPPRVRPIDPSPQYGAPWLGRYQWVAGDDSLAAAPSWVIEPRPREPVASSRRPLSTGPGRDPTRRAAAALDAEVHRVRHHGRGRSETLCSSRRPPTCSRYATRAGSTRPWCAPSSPRRGWRRGSAHRRSATPSRPSGAVSKASSAKAGPARWRARRGATPRAVASSATRPAGPGQRGFRR